MSSSLNNGVIIITIKRITLEKHGRRAIETSGNKILTTKEDVDIF